MLETPVSTRQLAENKHDHETKKVQLEPCGQRWGEGQPASER